MTTISCFGIVSAYDLIKELKNVKTVDELMLPAEPFYLILQRQKMQL